MVTAVEYDLYIFFYKPLALFTTQKLEINKLLFPTTVTNSGLGEVFLIRKVTQEGKNQLLLP